MTAAVIRNDGDHTIRLYKADNLNKHTAIYPSKRKTSRGKIVFTAFVDLVKLFDMFAVRPNLIAAPYGSSLVGLCGVVIILALSVITFALTLANMNVPEITILDSYLDQNNFGYSLQSGSSLKFAVCFNLASYLVGSNKLANLRFFTNTSANGIQYILPVQLSASDYATFDLTTSTSPVNLSYCFGIEPDHLISMGANRSSYGYFGLRIDPFCSSTGSYCQSNAASTNNNFFNFINNTSVYLFLP